MFGKRCCTFIPNNTVPDGRLTRAIEGQKTLNQKMKEHSGVDTSMWDGWMSRFQRRFKGLIVPLLMCVAVFAALLTLCRCCYIPCIRALIVKLINIAIGKVNGRPDTMTNLVANSYRMSVTNLDNVSFGLTDLCPDPDSNIYEELSVLSQ